jgi:AraC family transcriptional regulator
MDIIKIQHIVKFIEDNYHRNIPIQELEDIGCYSYRNLQRIFQNIFKETIGAFQKRLKLENAYKKLIYSQETITDIAYAVGFESLQSFTKSFKKQYRFSPSEARIKRECVFDEFVNTSMENSNIKYEIVRLNRLKIYYQSIKTYHYDNSEIDEFWDKIDTYFETIKEMNFYGIIVDQPLITFGENCRYEACVDKNPNDKQFLVKEIFGGKYAKYRPCGSYETIEDTYRLIYRNWLAERKLVFDNSPVIEHYVVNNYDNTTPQSIDSFITDIYFPLA